MEVDRGGRRELEIVESTFHRRRNQYGRMKADDAKRLKELTLLRTSVRSVSGNVRLRVPQSVARYFGKGTSVKVVVHRCEL